MQELDSNVADTENSFLGIDSSILFAIMELIEICVLVLFLALTVVHVLEVYNAIINKYFFVNAGNAVNILYEFLIEFVKHLLYI